MRLERFNPNKMTDPDFKCKECGSRDFTIYNIQTTYQYFNGNVEGNPFSRQYPIEEDEHINVISVECDACGEKVLNLFEEVRDFIENLFEPDEEY